jgi:hypothetical protein
VLLVKLDFWREVGGFDERFAPMCYEDMDMCFEARQRGMRVMYEPRAEVVHLENSTTGMDGPLSDLRYLEINWRKFEDKWREALQHEHSEEDPASLWAAANRGADHTGGGVPAAGDNDRASCGGLGRGRLGAFTGPGKGSRSGKFELLTAGRRLEITCGLVPRSC